MVSNTIYSSITIFFIITIGSTDIIIVLLVNDI